MLDLPWEDNSLAPKWNDKQKINVVSLKQFTWEIYLQSDSFISNYIMSDSKKGWKNNNNKETES